MVQDVPTVSEQKSTANAARCCFAKKFHILNFKLFTTLAHPRSASPPVSPHLSLCPFCLWYH